MRQAKLFEFMPLIVEDDDGDVGMANSPPTPPTPPPALPTTPPLAPPPVPPPTPLNVWEPFQPLLDFLEGRNQAELWEPEEPPAEIFPIGPPAPAAERVDVHDCLPPSLEDPPHLEELLPLNRVPVTVMGEGGAIIEIIIVMG